MKAQVKLHYTQMDPYSVRPDHLERIYYEKSVPCFHCNKSLQQLMRNHPTHPKKYLGFLVDGPDGNLHPVHGACIALYLLGMEVGD